MRGNQKHLKCNTLKMLVINIITFVEETNICKIILVYLMFSHQRKCLGKSSWLVWKTTSHCEVTVIWIFLWRVSVPQLVSEWLVPHCYCLFWPLGQLPSIAPCCGALDPAMSHLERGGRPKSLWKLLALSHSWCLSL